MAGLIEPEELETIEQVIKKFSVSLSPQLIETFNSSNDINRAGLLKQFLPTEAELEITETELKDPIGDTRYTTVKGVVHRHADRCLLMPITACPVYCRFCFRRESVGQKSPALTKDELQTAYNYIAEHKEIWEVIITGGEPLILKPKTLREILSHLALIEHVEVIRIHTRVPVLEPKRITNELIKALKINKAIYVAVSVNHPGEFTPEAIKACASLADNGISMLGQTVLLKGVNDDPKVMGQLMRTLVKNRIKPYYLHQADLAEGTSHFRTSIEDGQQLMKTLREQHSGLCQPTYVLDIPGGFGKVPVGANYIESKDILACEKGSYQIRDQKGKLHNYKN